jgi:hypothetical protein
VVAGEAGALGVGFERVDDFCHVAARVAGPRVAQQRWLVHLQDLSPDDREPQIAATALLGLWRIRFQALSKYLDAPAPPRRSTRP